MMSMSVLVAMLAVAVPLPQSADTVFAVERGARLNVDNHRGEVVVVAWDRDAVGVTSDLGSGQFLGVSRAGAVVRLEPRTRRGGPADADLRIAVPRWMDVRIEGNQLDVTVRGTEAEVSVETVSGDLEVDGGAGVVSLRTIQGEIRLSNARGRIEAVSVNEDVSLRDIGGDIVVEGTNGDITLQRIRSTNTRATTVNGDIFYDGSIRDGGRYGFSTHNGDISVSVPRGANATVSVSTYHGEFESDFPVRLTGSTRDRQFDFTLGDGSARIELESFNGEIRLRRP